MSEAIFSPLRGVILLIRAPHRTIKFIVLRLEKFIDQLFEVIGSRPILAGLLLLGFNDLVAGTLFAWKEHHSPFDSIYWANTTLTTVGYGDLSPHHALTKLEAMETQWAGIFAAALVVTVLVQKVMQARESELNDTPELSDDLDHGIAEVRRLHSELGAALSQLEEVEQQLRFREREARLMQ